MSLKNIMSRPGCPLFNKSTYILAANRSIRRKCCDIPTEDRERVDHTQDDNGLTWTRKPDESSTENGPKLFQYTGTLAGVKENDQGYFELSKGNQIFLEPLAESATVSVGPDGPTSEVWVQKPPRGSTLDKALHFNEKLVIAESCTGYKDDPRYFLLRTDGTDANTEISEKGDGIAIIDNGKQDTTVVVESLTVHDLNADGGRERTVRAVPIAFTECLPTITHTGKQPARNKFGTETQWSNDPKKTDYGVIVTFIGKALDNLANTTVFKFCENGNGKSMRNVLGGFDAFPEGWGHTNGGTPLFEVFMRNDNAKVDSDLLKDRIVDGLKSRAVGRLLSRGADLDNLVKLNRKSIGAPGDVIAKVEITMRWRPQALSQTYAGDVVPPTLKLASFTVILNPEAIELEPMFFNDEISGEPGKNGWTQGNDVDLAAATTNARAEAQKKAVDTISNLYKHADYRVASSLAVEWKDEIATAPDEDAGLDPAESTEHVTKTSFEVYDRRTDLLVATMRMYHQVVDVSTPLVTQLAEEYTNPGDFGNFHELLATKMKRAIAAQVEIGEKRVLWIKEGNAPTPSKVKEVFLQASNKGVLGTYHGPLDKDRVVITVDSKEGKAAGVTYMEHTYSVVLLAQSGLMTTYPGIVTMREVICQTLTSIFKDSTITAAVITFNSDGTEFKSECTLKGITDGENFSVVARPTITGANPDFVQTRGQLLFGEEEIYRFITCVSCNTTPGTDKNNGLLVVGDVTTRFSASLVDIKSEYKSISFARDRVVDGAEHWTATVRVRDRDGTQISRDITVIQMPQHLWWEAQPLQPQLLPGTDLYNKRIEILSSSLREDDAVFSTKDLGSFGTAFSIDIADVDAKGKFPHLRVVSTFGPVDQLECCDKDQMNARMEHPTDTVHVSYTAKRTPGSAPIDIPGENNPVNTFLASADSTREVEYKVHDDEDPIIASRVLGELLCTKVKECDGSPAIPDNIADSMIANETTLEKSDPKSLVRCVSDDLEKDVDSVVLRQSVWLGCGTNANTRSTRSKTWKVDAKGKFQEDATVVGNPGGSVVVTTSVPPPPLNLPGMVLYTSDELIDIKEFTTLADLDALLAKLRPVTATDGNDTIVYAATTKLKTKSQLDASEIRARNDWKLFTIAGSVENIHTLHGVKADGFICVALADIKVKDVASIDDIIATYLQAEPRGWLKGVNEGLIEADGMKSVNTLHGVLQSFISLDLDDGKCLEAEANYQELLSHLKANGTSLAAAVLGSVYIAASALVVTDKAGNSATRTAFQVYYDTQEPSKDGLNADLVATPKLTAAVLQKVLRAEAADTYDDLVAARKQAFAVDEGDKKVDDTCEGRIDIETAEYRKSDIRHTFMRGLYGAKTGTNEEVFITVDDDGLNIPIPVAQDENVRDMSISRYASDCVGNTAHEEEIVSIRDTEGIASSTLAAAEAAGTGGFAKESVFELDVLGGSFVMLGTNDGAMSLNAVAELIQVGVSPVAVQYISSELFSFERPGFEYYQPPNSTPPVLSTDVPTAQSVGGIYRLRLHENQNDTIDKILSSTYGNYPDARNPGTIDKVTIVSSLGLDLQGKEIEGALQIYDTDHANVEVSYTDARNYELVWCVDDGGEKTVVVRHATRPIVLVDVEESTLGFDKTGGTNFPTKFESVNAITVNKATPWTEMIAIDDELKKKVKAVIEGVDDPLHNEHYKVLHKKSRTITGKAAQEEADKLIANGDIDNEADFKNKVAAVDITEYCICLSNVKECIYTEYTVSYDVTGFTLHYGLGTPGVNVISVGKGGAGGLVTKDDLDLSTLVEEISDIAPLAGERGVAATLVKGYYFDQEGNVFNLASSDLVADADVNDVEQKLQAYADKTVDKEKWGASDGRRLIEAVYVEWQAVDGFGNDVENPGSNWQIWALMVEGSDEQDVVSVSDSIEGWDSEPLKSMESGSNIKKEGDSDVLDVVVPLTLDLAESANAVIQWSAMGRSGTKKADSKTEMPFGPFEVTSFYEPALDIETDVVEDISPRTINEATTTVKKLVFSSEIGGNNGGFTGWRSRTVDSTSQVSIRIAVDSVFKHWSWPYEDGASKSYDLLKHLDDAAGEDDNRVAKTNTLGADSSRSLEYTIKGTKAYSSAATDRKLVLLEQDKGNGIAIGVGVGAVGASPLVDGDEGSLTTGVLYDGGAGNAKINEGIGLVLEAVDSGSAMRLRGFAGSVKQSTYDSTRPYSAATNDDDVEIVYYKDRLFYAQAAVGKDVAPLDAAGTVVGDWAKIDIKPASVNADGVVYMVEEFPDYYSIWRSDVRLDAVYDKQGGKLATLVKSGDAIDERVGFAPAHSHNPPAADSYTNEGAADAKVVMEGGDVKYKLIREREVQDGDSSRLSAMLDVDITMPDEVHVLGNSEQATKIGYVSGRSVDLPNDTTLSYDKDGKLQIVLKDDGEWLTVSRLVANGKLEKVQPANAILENDKKLHVVYGDGFRVTVPFDMTQLATTVKFVVPQVDDTTATTALDKGTYDNPDFAELPDLSLKPGTTTVAQWKAFVAAVKDRLDLTKPGQEYSLFKAGADVTGSATLVTVQSNAVSDTRVVNEIDGMEAVLDVYGEQEGHLQVVVRVTVKLPDSINLGDTNVLLKHFSVWLTETFKLDLLYSDVSQAIWVGEGPVKLTIQNDWDGKFQENVVLLPGLQETKYGNAEISDISIDLRPKDGGDAIRIPIEVASWLLVPLYGAESGVPLFNPANNLAKQLADAGKGSISLQVATASGETKSVDLGFKLTLVSKAYGRTDRKKIVLDACDVMTHPPDAKLLRMTGAFDDSSSGEPQFTLDGAPVDVVKVGTEETNEEEEGNNPYAVVYHDNSGGDGNEVNIVLLMPQHLALYDATSKTAAESDLFDALTKK